MHKNKKDTAYNVFPEFIYRIPLFSLPKIYNENWFQSIKSTTALEALFLASPEFLDELLKWEYTQKKQNEIHNIRITILKYYLRMSCRCTPFGLFAGCGLGAIGKNDEMVVSSIQKHKSRTRLDMNYLCSLIKEIASLLMFKGN